ncbi:MAG TPA: hypothetical protein VFL56_01775 [Solirubrobacterales bacterium]|nr:hypothetical protein [Solirubrobacterales bacterium]
MEASANRIEPGRVIGEAFETYRNYAAVLLGGALIVIGVAGVINGLLAASESLLLILLGLLVSFVAGALYTGYVVKLVQDVRDGRLDQSVGGLFSAAAPFILTLILNGIVFWIAVGIGLVLLIIPGLILITIWAVVAPSIVVENRGAIEAFGRSRELVRGNGWSVFGAIVIAFLIVIAISIVAGAIGAAIGDAGRVIVGAIGNVISYPILALVSSILFFDLGGGAGAIPPASEQPPAAPPPAAPPPAA